MTKTLCEVYPIGGVIGSMHASNAVDHGVSQVTDKLYHIMLYRVHLLPGQIICSKCIQGIEHRLIYCELEKQIVQ
jgi:hypothetical protein